MSKANNYGIDFITHTFIFWPELLIVNSPSFSMRHQDILPTLKVPHISTKNPWCHSIYIISYVADDNRFIDGDPGFDPVTIEGVYHTSVVREPVRY